MMGSCEANSDTGSLSPVDSVTSSAVDLQIKERNLWASDLSTSQNIVDQTPLVSLAKDILKYARTISGHFAAHELLQPSFALDAPETWPSELPQDIHDVRTKLRGAVADMNDLAVGPKESIMWMAWGYHDVSLLRYIQHFQVAEAIPLVGSVSAEEIAVATSTACGRLKRMLRYLSLRHVFAEPEHGRFAHTPASRQLVTSEHVRSWVGVRTEETGPASFGLIAATERWGHDPQELNQTPYSHVHSDGKLSRFEVLALPENKERQGRFAKLMKALQATETYDLKHTVHGYAWQELGDEAVVVDIGGSTASTARALVETLPNLRVVVQDLPGVVAQGKKLLPPSLSSRIEFMDYNFLEQIQPVTDADAYCFRHIFHDWPDKYAIRALRNTASVMQKGQKLIIVDVVMPAPGSVDSSIERTLRASDMEMMIQFNALEREAADWKRLIQQADFRLEVLSIHTPIGSANSIIEIVIKDM